MLRIYKTVKIQRLRPGLNPRTWVPEASMLTTRPPKLSYLRVSKLTVRYCCEKNFDSRPTKLHCKEFKNFHHFA